MWSIAVKAILGVLLSIGLDKIIKNFTGGNDKPKRIATPRKSSTSQPQTGMSTTTKILLGVGAVGLGYIGWRAWRVSTVLKNSDKPDVQRALELNEALKDKGFLSSIADVVVPLMTILVTPVDSVKQLIENAKKGGIEEIIAVGKQIENFEEVQKWYAMISGSDLKQDLAKKLKPNELNEFYKIADNAGNNAPVNAGGNTAIKPQNSKTKKGDIIIVNGKTANFRATPTTKEDLPSQFLNYWFSKNILTTIPKGGFVGFATGREEFDANQTRFVEVAVMFGANAKIVDWRKNPNIPPYYVSLFEKKYKGQAENPVMYGWIAASLVKNYKTLEAARADYTTLPIEEQVLTHSSGAYNVGYKVRGALVLLPSPEKWTHQGLQGLSQATINGIPVPLQYKKR